MTWPQDPEKRRQAELRSDDWSHVARMTDEDGRYRTPLRAAISRIRDPWLRLFIRDLIAEELRPSDIAMLYGIPKSVEGWVMQGSGGEGLEGRGGR